MNAGLDGAPRTSPLRLVDASRATSTASTRFAHPQPRVPRRQLARCASAPSAGRRSEATEAQVRGHARHAARGDGAGRHRPLIRASTIRPARTPDTDELAAAHGRGGAPRRLLSHPRALRARRPLPRPLPRGDRDRPARRGPVHITHFYHRQTFPGGPEPMLALVDDARAEGLDVTFDTYPYEWASTRLLIMIPPWVQAGGPMRNEGAPGGCSRPRPHPARAGRARRPLRRPAAPGTTSGSAHSRRPTCCAGRAGRSAS